MLKFNGGEGDGIKVKPIKNNKKLSEKEKQEKIAQIKPSGTMIVVGNGQMYMTTSPVFNDFKDTDFSIDPKYLSKTEQAKLKKPTVSFKSNSEQIATQLNNAKLAFSEAAKSTKKLNEYLSDVNTKVMSDDYIFTTIKPQDTLMCITRKADNYFFGVYQKVTTHYDVPTDQYAFDVRIVEAAENVPPDHSITKIMRYSVDAEVLNSANKSHLRHMIVKGFSNEMTKALNVTAFEAEVILNNILQFKDLPGPTFNGTLYHNFAKGGYVKDGGILPKGTKPLKKPYVFKDFHPAPKSKAGYVDVSTKSKSLPGVHEKAACPLNATTGCCGPTPVEIWGLIQHLNDDTPWTREQIADWLDSLADDGIINIDFPTPEIKGFDIGEIIVDEIQDFLENGEQK